MASFAGRYITLLGTVLSVFVMFVACGSQLYKVSLHDDTSQTSESPSGGATNTGSTDPTSATYGLHAPDGWAQVPVHFKVDANLSPDHLQGVMRAMNVWSIAAGRPLFAADGVHAGVSGDSFKDLYSSLADRINGQYLDNNWGKTGKPTVVLATTIWDNDPNDARRISTADIRFNGQYYVFGDSLVLKSKDTRDVVDVQTLATHELGHLLGLAHIDPGVDGQSIMIASIYIGEGLTNRRISKGDIQRLQRIYGCQGSACDIDATLAAIDKMTIAPKQQASLSQVDRN